MFSYFIIYIFSLLLCIVLVTAFLLGPGRRGRSLGTYWWFKHLDFLAFIGFFFFSLGGVMAIEAISWIHFEWKQ